LLGGGLEQMFGQAGGLALKRAQGRATLCGIRRRA
jgi:hypothetical protein